MEILLVNIHEKGMAVKSSINELQDKETSNGLNNEKVKLRDSIDQENIYPPSS